MEQKIKNKIKKILETKEHVRIQISDLDREVWFYDKGGVTELRLLLSRDGKQLIISRVFLIQKRQGTMTEILKILKSYCKQEGIPEIIVQSILTKDMENFCHKHGFSFVESSNPDYMIYYDVLAGNYSLSI